MPGPRAQSQIQFAPVLPTADSTGLALGVPAAGGSRRPTLGEVARSWELVNLPGFLPCQPEHPNRSPFLFSLLLPFCRNFLLLKTRNCPSCGLANKVTH